MDKLVSILTDMLHSALEWEKDHSLTPQFDDKIKLSGSSNPPKMLPPNSSATGDEDGHTLTI